MMCTSLYKSHYLSELSLTFFVPCPLWRVIDVVDEVSLWRWLDAAPRFVHFPSITVTRLNHASTTSHMPFNVA